MRRQPLQVMHVVEDCSRHHQAGEPQAISEAAMDLVADVSKNLSSGKALAAIGCAQLANAFTWRSGSVLEASTTSQCS